MPLDQPRYIGKNLAIDIDGAITIWRDFTVTLTKNTSDATAADSTLDEVVGTTDLLEFSASGFIGSVNNGATLPAVGDAVATLDANDDDPTTPTSILPDLSAYTNIKVLTAEYSMSADPATWSISGRSGVLAV